MLLIIFSKFLLTLSGGFVDFVSKVCTYQFVHLFSPPASHISLALDPLLVVKILFTIVLSISLEHSAELCIII